MAEEQSFGADSDDRIDWDTIDWDKVEKDVKRLQARIVKATEAGRRNKAKVLQGLLVRSRSARLLAVKRVTENDGSKTPGVDKVTWEHRRSKEMAVALLRKRGYKPLPLRRLRIPKPNGTMRLLGVPAMLDRAMQALYLLALDPVAETTADPNSYGFRLGRSCADAIEQCHNALRGGRDRWILEGDIKGCFDHISHGWLLEHVPMDRSILRKWLECGYMERNVFAATTEGTPQGGIISPVLANLTLDGLEPLLRKLFPLRGKGSQAGRDASVRLVRYADDFVITASSKELLETQIRPLVAEFLKERGLELSEEKTKITHLRDGFDFLGQNVRAFGNKTLVRPSKKNIAAFLGKIRKVVKANKQATAADLVQLLNPMIRGWANYHRHASSKRTFTYVDYQIHCILIRWARRRHLTERKSSAWVANKYFCVHGDRQRCFFGDERNHQGERVRYWLHNAASTRIVRHEKVKSSAHPYAPEWQEYWRKRAEASQTGKRLRIKPQTFDMTVRPPRPVWGVTEARAV
jgi:RNA-directed DNA polymerase